MVATHEPNKGERLNDALLKTLTGGDSITVRGLYERQEVEFEPQFNIWLTANHNPKLLEGDSGNERRIRYMKFVTKPPVPDESLKDKLTEPKELSGILAWAVRGAQSVPQHGLNEPAVVNEWTRKYHESNNVLSEFFDESVEVNPSYKTKQSDLLLAINQWRSGEDMKPMTSAQISKAMKNLHYENKPQRLGEKTERCWIGLRLKHSPHFDRTPGEAKEVIPNE